MNLHTERPELLPTSLMNLGQSRTSTTTTTSTLTPLHTEDKDDSIYTFSNDESDFMDSKYGSRLGSTVMNSNYSPTSDKNLNDTRNFALKESIRTYSKKKVSSSSVSPRNDRKKTPTQATNYSTTPSCSPLQSFCSPVPLSPFSDESNSQTQKSNGSAQIDQSSMSPTSIVKKSPSGGKPKSFAMAIESSKKSSASTATKTSRGRPKRKALVAMYQSQLSENTMGIKIRLKKSLEAPISMALSSSGTGSTKKKQSITSIPAIGSPGTAGIASPLATGTSTKTTRKRQRKSRAKDTSDSDDSDYEKRRKNNNTTTEKHRNRKQTTNTATDYTEPDEQSQWGNNIPEHVLLKIFEEAVNQYGTLPIMVNVSRVCTLWRRVSQSSQLWHTLDLSNWAKDRSEINLKQIIATHLTWCKDVNLANWKVTNIECVLDHLLDACPNLEAISLAGWKEFTGDHLAYLVEEFKSLQRIDLSSVNLELNPNRSAVGPQSLCSAIQSLGGRLTHLNLAHNRLAGIPQLITALSTHCPNLSLLDLSNVSTVAASHGVLHIEKLQEGCSHLKVLRITNSQISLSAATLVEQMESLGFPELEELSVASLADESRLMNDEFLQRILKTSTKLKLLDVRGCARLTHDTLIRLPTWDLKHLFLSGCSVTRDIGSGLELIASKWAHSLTELDLAWANVQEPLDNAIKAIAEKGDESPLNHLNLCGSSVSLEAVKEILSNCRYLNSINLSSCRGLPRGVKRLMQGTAEISELRENLGVKLKYSANNNADRSFDSTSQSATPNSSADIADK
ncbi:F-box/LRR-repeat protein 6 isoform X2 [Contarinia nasturtii]|uniref:F-box/LRR-repeat protein 6 isoform X2 n=1 Tax=Contarinia nasturtii TaxID=265458 RepID=UPI0012D41FCA|nr:F-box/LRR-repeat protein 6 isoform X2 [Contarinia nasturtii]